MQLSKFSTEKAVDILCELTPYIKEISTDKELSKILKDKIKNEKNMSQAEIIVFALNKVGDLIPVLLGTHKEAVFNILAILNEKTVTEIKEQSIIVTMGMIKEAIQDEDLISFFSSSAH